MGQARNWTEQEKEFLSENWGTLTVPTICEKLNRSRNAIMIMVHKLNLGAYYDSGDYITLHQLFLTLGYSSSTMGYANESWIKNRGLPVRQKKHTTKKVKIVYLDDFWEWAEKNQAFLDFSRFEENALGLEADWVKEKRKRDQTQLKENIKDPWSPEEDAYLKDLLKAHRFTYPEISKRLKRTEGAIQRRITDLNLKERPVKASNSYWTDDQFAILSNSIKQGFTYEAIHEKIPDKSTKAIRGYVFRFYLTESLDKVRSYIGDGSFGDNMPERKLYQRQHMTPEQRYEVKENVSQLAYLLNQRARQLSPVSAEYKDYWQKDMCMNWDPIHGCKAGEKSCDSCSSFIRIREQYCIRCGATIISRDKLDLCSACRTARKKQAQRKWAILSKRQARREE